MKLSRGANQRTMFRCLVAEPFETLRCYAETNKLIINCYFQCQNAPNSHCILINGWHSPSVLLYFYPSVLWRVQKVLAFPPLKIGTVDFFVGFDLFSSPFCEGSQHLPRDQIFLRGLIPIISNGFSFK